jgi:hypothetical protein
MEDWKLVFSSNKIHEVEYIKDVLENNNIVSVIVNKKDSAYLLGDVELYVPVEHAFDATQIINKLERE